MLYRDFKDLTRRTTFDKILHNKALTLLKAQNMMDIKGALLQWFIDFLIIRRLILVSKIRILKVKI